MRPNKSQSLHTCAICQMMKLFNWEGNRWWAHTVVRFPSHSLCFNNQASVINFVSVQYSCIFKQRMSTTANVRPTSGRLGGASMSAFVSSHVMFAMAMKDSWLSMSAVAAVMRLLKIQLCCIGTGMIPLAWLLKQREWLGSLTTAWANHWWPSYR